MILEELVLHNFGVYKGRQVVDLRVTNPKKPIILIGGLNGGGKTTFLDALQLALYGRHAKLSNRGELAYEDYLERTIHRDVARTTGAAVELQFQLVIAGVSSLYRVHRSWAKRGKSVKELVEVTVNGDKDTSLTEHWSQSIEGLIPSRVSQLFFFDGEKIQDLADFNETKEVLHTAISGLLGLDLVEKLATDLSALQRRKRKDSQSPTDQSAINEIEQGIEFIASQVQQLKQDRAEATTQQHSAQAQLRKLKRRFEANGGDVYENRHKLEQQRDELQQRLAETEERMREVAAGPAPLLLVEDQLEAILEQDQREQELKRRSLVADAINEHSSRMMQVVEEAGATKKILKAVSAFVERETSSETADEVEVYLNLSDEARHQIRTFLEVQRQPLRREISQLVSLSEQLESDIETVDSALAAVPDDDQLADLIGDINKARKAVERAQHRIEHLAELIAVEKRKVEDSERRLTKLLESAASVELEAEDNERVADYSTRVQGILGVFKEKVVQAHVGKIQDLVRDCYRQLLRKKTLIEKVRIDSSDFSIELTTTGGKRISPDELSAGERQLFAVSLLWGLARASTRPLPAIIDTPLGRLDSEHRSNLVEHYFPLASHQVLLLSTDKEIDEHLYTDLKRFVAKSYLLTYDDTHSATQVERGYFW